jgi:hypothetical protein
MLAVRMLSGYILSFCINHKDENKLLFRNKQWSEIFTTRNRQSLCFVNGLETYIAQSTTTNVNAD